MRVIGRDLEDPSEKGIAVESPLLVYLKAGMVVSSYRSTSCWGRLGAGVRDCPDMFVGVDPADLCPNDPDSNREHSDPHILAGKVGAEVV